MACRAGAGDRVAYPTPTYPLLEPLCRIHEAVSAPHATGHEGVWAQDFVDDPAPLKFIVNPNSPTGTWAGSVAVEKVIDASTGVVVVDEPEHRPALLILAVLPRVGAHRGLDAAHVAAQLLGLGHRADELPGFVPRRGVCRQDHISFRASSRRSC